MTGRSAKLLLWSPRILGILVCLFLSLFAFDARTLPDFAMHVAPMLVLLAVVGVSWRWECVGGVVFTALAAGYAYFARDHVSWIPVIAGPLLIVGILFTWSWIYHQEVRAAS